MSIYPFLKLQPVDVDDDATSSDLNYYEPDDVIDLTSDIDEETLDAEWDQVIHDFNADADKIDFDQA